MKTSRMEALSLLNPFYDPELQDGEFVNFTTIRKENKRNGGTFLIVPGSCRVLIPELDENNKPKPERESMPLNKGGKMKLVEEIIVYIPGESSIFLSDIVAGKKNGDEDEIKQRAEDILIVGGSEKVPRHEINRIAYLRACQSNADIKFGGSKFPTIKEYHKKIAAAAYFEKHIPRFGVSSKVTQLIEDGKTMQLWLLYAFLKNMSVSDVKKITDPNIMKLELMKKAEVAPEALDKVFEDQNTTNKVYVMQAFYDGLLTVDSNGSVKNKDGHQVAFVALGANQADATHSQIEAKYLHELKTAIGPLFHAEIVKEKQDNAKIARLEAEVERLRNLQKIGTTVDPQKLKDVMYTAVSKEDAEKFLLGLVATGLVSRTANWLKGDCLPPTESYTKKDIKTWNIDMLSEFLSENPSYYHDMLKGTGTEE